MRILFADDEQSLQEVMRCELPRMGHSVAVCPDGTTAIAALQKETFDCLLVDLDMPGANGIEVIEVAKECSPDIDAVVLTGKGTLDTAIAALRNGVFDYISKPCRLAELEKILLRIEEKQELTRKNLALQNQLQRAEGTRELIGSSPLMKQVHRLIDRIAPSESTVVILGETGTGKELVARAIHQRSLRAEKPFVAVNCGALPENLIESELFGHRKGSFTGADEHRTGLLQVANGGTLFLDEIGELPKAVQAKLLRFLESGEVRKIGENQTTTCDVRVVCATLRNLESMVRTGEFREDLWFRINTFEIALPPLRDRIEDLPELILHLTKRFQGGVKIRKVEDLFTSDAFKLLCEYHWPGNVRQLANTIEHSLILTDRLPISVDFLPGPIRNPRPVESRPCPSISERERERERERDAEREQGRERVVQRRPDRPITKSREKDDVYFVQHGPHETPGAPSDAFSELLSFDPEIPVPGKTLRDLELDAIQLAMERNEGNKAKAAEELGISLKTLYNKLNQNNDGKKAG